MRASPVIGQSPRRARIIATVAFVNVRFAGFEAALSEEDARFLAEQLEQRRRDEPIACVLATRIEQRAEAATFAAPTQDVELDEAERGELVVVLDSLDLDVQLTEQVRALHRGLRELQPESP